ncbi:Myb-like DNA-binding domain protein [Metarhizium album ARSEF 1941]|uniref:Myb-like DNA-binding domain protein n=1 Tax=Metarhizium album (strain ARSEF 1941) TaxID=1081103 RepID=A0A0B2WKZ5_METAS|nr:Myb-like DNA-binding domain protein [Metarhizium album ARSEF 1941]KHN96721.1 Myb-like DNA-binding domain protein [Metarhizium album ARSEF 1941]
MEPQVKRRRLGEHPQLWDDDADGDDEDWEEYDEDDHSDNGQAALGEREGSVEQDDGYQLAIEKAYADNRFRATMARIFEKYGRDFEGIGDEIDLCTGEIVVNNGHIENMRNEVDVGDDPRSPNGNVDNDHRDDDEENFDDGGAILPDDRPEDERGPYYSRELGADDTLHDDDDASQSWTSDADDTKLPPGNVQLQRLQQPFSPESVDAISGYDLKSDGSPSLISGLYGGGGLRYASSLGEFGASPLALGPWDTLPQAQERYEFPKQDGSGSIWAPDYRFNDNEPEHRPAIRARLGPSRARPTTAKRPKALLAPWAGKGGRERPTASHKRTVNAPKQHYDKLGKQMMPLGNLSWVETMEESDTIDDAVFSSAEAPLSSDTGDMTDEMPQPKPTSASEPASRIIPDSQDSYASLGNQPTQSSAKSKPPQPPKSKQRDYKSACVLSDDESPLYSPLVESSSTTNPTTSARALPNATAVPASNANADGTVVKRGRGRPRKYPPGYRPPRTYRRKPKAPLSELPGLTRPLIVPTMPNMSFMPTMSTAPTAQATMQPRTQQIRSETVPQVKRKRGRPRKYPLPGTVPQQSPKSSSDKRCQQPKGQEPFLQTFQPSFQQQGFQYPLNPLFQQPLFQFPQQGSYQPWYPLQQSYIQHPMFQFPQRIVQQPIQQLWQQPIIPYRPAQPLSPSQPVKRKRGRPRKYPVKFDSVYPGYVMNRKRSASKKAYEEFSSHQQLPGLQNSMTALLSGQSGRTMVSEDAWYGVARQLAQDIACLQGGSLFESQFQAGPPTSIERTSRSSSEEAGTPETDSFSSPETGDEPARITELPEVSNIDVASTTHQGSHIEAAVSFLDDMPVPDQGSIESYSIDRSMPDPASTECPPAERDIFDQASPESVPFDSDLIDPALIDPALTEQASVDLSAAELGASEPAPALTDSDTFDPTCIDPALLLEDSDSPMEDDDGGFVVTQSPVKSVTGGAQPTPSPPSPPPSMRRSSPLKGEGRCTPSPAPEHNVDRHTPTSLESAKDSKPLRYGPDAFDLPSSPEPLNNRIATRDAREKGPVLEPEETLDYSSSLSLQGAPDFVGADGENGQACTPATERPPELPPIVIVDTAIKDSIVSEQGSSTSNEKSVETAAASLEVVPKAVDDCQRLVTEPQKSSEQPILQPSQPKERQEDDQAASGAETKSSPKTITSPRTPEPQKPVELTNQTPRKLPERRSPKVPRSAERCAPIFAESPIFVKSPTRSPPNNESPLSKRRTTERRTMGELKKAILEPRQRDKITGCSRATPSKNNQDRPVVCVEVNHVDVKRVKSISVQNIDVPGQELNGS